LFSSENKQIREIKDLETEILIDEILREQEGLDADLKEEDFF
jgi:hypothetical protein